MIYIFVLTTLVSGKLDVSIQPMNSLQKCNNVLAITPQVIQENANKLNKVIKFKAKCIIVNKEKAI